MTGSGAAGWYRWDGPDLILTLRVQPRAARDELWTRQGATPRLRITAPPVDDRANRHAVDFLAVLFAVPRSQVSLEKGQRGREKRFRIRSPRRLPEAVIHALPPA